MNKGGWRSALAVRAYPWPRRRRNKLTVKLRIKLSTYAGEHHRDGESYVLNL